MASQPKGPEGDLSPGDIAERELTGKRPPMRIRLEKREDEEEPPDDRAERIDEEPEEPNEA